jgi:hypothetical protein
MRPSLGEQRKFINPTPGFVGANVFGGDGKPTAIAVEPGGEIWLTPEEERMTAEAPRLAMHNPFVMEWEEPIEFDSFGGVTATATRRGTLVLADEPARPIASDRFIPERVPEQLLHPDPTVGRIPDSPAEETQTGAPPQPEQPPVVGQPSPAEIVGTPEAVPANDEALARRASTAEQPVLTGGIPV